MLSYRHIFHAGNHADIFKHTALSLLLEHLNSKDKPYTVIDTHAGAGRYDLSDERAQKTGEAAAGINTLLAENTPLPAGYAARYGSFCRSCLAEGFYSGSPELERSLMRPSDTLILCELHSAEIDVLRQTMRLPPASGRESCSVQIHHRNGFEALRALTPPQIKRGMVFTDPSYEDAFEYDAAAEAFSGVHERWPAAVLALWYPLIARRSIECSTMKQKITASVKSSAVPCSVLDAQLLIQTPDSHRETPLDDPLEHNPPRLYGSGMLIVNVPWKLDEELSAVLPYYAAVLGTEHCGSWNVRVL